MANTNQRNTSKNRKSEAQEQFEAADNAWRFAGNDTNAKAAREQALETVRQDTNAARNERDGSRRSSGDNDYRGSDGRQSQEGEAQNVNDDTVPPLSDEEAARSKNKATEGLRQGRDERQ